MIRRSLSALASSIAKQKRLTRRFFFSSKEKKLQKQEADELPVKDRDIKAMPNLKFLIDKVKEQNATRGTRLFPRTDPPAAVPRRLRQAHRLLRTGRHPALHLRPRRIRRLPLPAASVSSLDDREHDLYLELPEFNTSIYVYKRPHLDTLMNYLETEVEAVLFTTAHEYYVEKIMAKVDPEKKVFKHRIYQADCDRVEYKDEEVDTLVKDLGVVGRDLSRVVLVDSKPFSFWSHPDNAYPLKEYRGGILEEPDLELLLDSLRELQTAKDVRPILSQRFFVRDALRESNLL